VCGVLLVLRLLAGRHCSVYFKCSYYERIYGKYSDKFWLAALDWLCMYRYLEHSDLTFDTGRYNETKYTK